MKKISVGLATIAGMLGAILAAIVPIIGELADSTRPLGVSPDLWVKVSAFLAVAVVIGRMAQAVAVALRGGQP